MVDSRVCKVCKEDKPLSDYYTDKYGNHPWECKACISQKKKRYHKKNRYRVNDRMRLSNSLPVKYTTFCDKLPTDVCRENDKGQLEVKCFKCKEWFAPSRNSVNCRIKAVNGGYGLGTEYNLYCSDNCKQSCDTYRQVNQYKHQMPLNKRVRCNQRVNKQALLEIQIDNHGYNFCEKCGVKTNKLAIHHNLMVSKYPKEADNLSHQLLVCGKCHTHKEC